MNWYAAIQGVLVVVERVDHLAASIDRQDDLHTKSLDALRAELAELRAQNRTLSERLIRMEEWKAATSEHMEAKIARMAAEMARFETMVMRSDAGKVRELLSARTNSDQDI